MQHAGLKDSCTADILTVEFLVRLVDWFFPDFNYTWLVEEIKNTTPKVCLLCWCQRRTMLLMMVCLASSVHCALTDPN